VNPAVFLIPYAIAVAALLVRSTIVNSPGGLEAWQVKRRHRRTASSPIGELPENELGQITGRAAAFERTLTSPLTGRPCLYYALVVMEYRATTKRWRACVNERRGVSFALEDRTGRAIIDPSNAQLALHFDHIERLGYFDAPTDVQRAILDRHGIRAEGMLFTKRLRFHEALVEVGDDLAAIGAGIREPDLASPRESDYRAAFPTRLHVTNSASAPLSLMHESQR
jgi:E3 Ubiquitin ligase